jgi:hypothetical protein
MVVRGGKPKMADDIEAYSRSMEVFIEVYE